MRDIFLLVDGNSLMHRAFHALPLMEADGIYTNAIYGFLSMLLKVINEESVQYLAVCFDEHGPTFRHTVYPEYKAGRRETPQELRQQFTTILTLLDELGIRRYSLQGWEADDLLGTLSRKGEQAGAAPLLLTGDRDALQLVDGKTELMFTRKGISETIRFTPSKVYEEFGFTPDQVTDWKGLAGDSSDNIPGVPGIGDKTAVKLLQQYGNLENILSNAENVKGKLGEKLKNYADQARFSKELATIHRDAPIEFSLNECLLSDIKKGIPALKKLKLNSIIRRMGDDQEKEETDGAKITFLSFEPAVSLTSEQKIADWLHNTKNDGQLCLFFEETVISLARKGGKQAKIILGGDLLTPGIDPETAFRVLSEELKNGDAIIHDGKTWLHRIDRFGTILPESFGWDTMLAAYLLNPQEKSYRLKALCPDQPENAATLCSLAIWQQEQVEKDGMMKLMREIEQPLSFVLFRMEKAGFTVDPDFLQRLGDQYRSEIAERKAQVIQAAGGYTFNLNSPQQLGEVLFERMNLPHGKKTSKGYSTSVEVLEGLRFEAPELIEPLLRYRQLTKLNGTYIEGLMPLVDRENRVHSTFDQTATATGRISSSEPNLQNIPVRTEEGKEIREAFLPREGWILLDADYSQIELRLMAHFSGDSALINAFRNGEDIHALTASEIFDVPLDWVTPELRSRAKAVNFGLIYGISGFGLSRNTGVSRREAAEFIDKYFRTYPGVKRFMDRTAAEGAEKGYAETLMGRRRYLPELRSSKAPVREFGKRAAMNTPVQGTAADIIKLAMVRVDRALREAKMKSQLILQVHDELLLECPPEEVKQASELLREAMEGAIELRVPLVAEVHQGQNWAEAK